MGRGDGLSPAVLAALGLIAPLTEGCAGPCLDIAVETDDSELPNETDSYVGPCLDMIETDETAETGDSVGPCLDMPLETDLPETDEPIDTDTDVSACLDMEVARPETPAAVATRAVLGSVVEKGELPADILEALRAKR